MGAELNKGNLTLHNCYFHVLGKLLHCKNVTITQSNMSKLNASYEENTSSTKVGAKLVFEIVAYWPII